MRTLRLLSIALALPVLACGPASIAVPETLAVSYVAPHHGAIDVAVDTSVEIGFNTRLDLKTVTADAIVLEQAGQGVAVQQVFVLDGQIVMLVPASVLSAGTPYTVLVAETVAGVDGGELGVPLRTRFRTAP